jgi:hypothetical protein
VANPFDYGDLIGGDTLTAEIEGLPPGISSLSGTKGALARETGTTRKYRTDIDGATETMARLMVPRPDASSRWRFVASVTDPEAHNLAKYVTTYGEQKNQMATAGTGLGYIDFLLQNIQETYEEKVQIVDVLSDNYVAYYFGTSPPIFRYSGKLLNTYQDDWRAAFTILYRSVMRGTQLARRKANISLAYDNVVISGTMLNMSQVLTAEMQMAADFNFSLLVKRYDIYRLPGTKSTTPGVDLFSKGLVNPEELAIKVQTGRVPRQFRTISKPEYVISEPNKDDSQTLEQGDDKVKKFSP